MDSEGDLRIRASQWHRFSGFQHNFNTIIENSGIGFQPSLPIDPWTSVRSLRSGNLMHVEVGDGPTVLLSIPLLAVGRIAYARTQHPAHVGIDSHGDGRPTTRNRDTTSLTRIHARLWRRPVEDVKANPRIPPLPPDRRCMISKFWV